MLAKDIYIASQAIKALTSEKLPIKAAYSITKLAKRLEAEFADLEKSRVDLVKKYGTEDESGNWAIQPNTTELQGYFKEFTDFLDNTDIEGPFPEINLDHFGEITISADVMFALYPFVKAS